MTFLWLQEDIPIVQCKINITGRLEAVVLSSIVESKADGCLKYKHEEGVCSRSVDVGGE